MNKSQFIFVALLALVVIGNAQIPKLLFTQRRLQYSVECNMHGVLYQGKCFCEAQRTGDKCEKTKTSGYVNTDDKCDDFSTRLDNLFNISPSFYQIDDDEFPRLTGNSIGEGEAAYGEKGNTWIKMHDVASPFRIIGDSVEPRDIGQGALGDCYLLAAFASLANVRKGELIRDAFMSLEDNANHVYVSRWLIDGKPRIVAVDDWIPGSGNRPSFAQVIGYQDKDFWGIILEKAWAKIHGSFMITEGGWHTEVWKALTMAPTFDAYHNKHTADSIYTLVKEKLDNEYPVGSATVSNAAQNLVQGHAYSVLGVYDVQLEDRSDSPRQKLIECFNPWNSEQWEANPWHDNSAKWTDFTRKQVKFEKRNDGVFYLTPEDYLANFGVTNWAETKKGYSITYQEIALTAAVGAQQQISNSFTLSNNQNQDVYISIPTINGRLLNGCGSPYNVGYVSVTLPNGQKAQGWSPVKVTGAVDGTYTVSTTVTRTKDYHKYVTITLYVLKGAAKFAAITNNEQQIKYVNCPNDCSSHGRCNFFNGACTCYFGFSGTDCSTTVKKGCPENCNGNGSCDETLGVCTCYQGFDDAANCKPCVDNEGATCPRYQADACQNYVAFMSTRCKKYCGAKGLPGYGTCTIKSNQVCPNNCSGHGTCSNGVCSCSSGYVGNDCSQKSCLNNCNNRGTCSNGVCTCSSGWTGADCSAQVDLCATVKCSGNAACNKATGKCECLSGYTGTNCDQKVCPNNCNYHGTCNNGVCVCSTGFSGASCETATCPSNCNNRGACINGKCICNSGYTGTACETSTACPSNCNNRGTCSNGKCTCNSGFTGTACETSTACPSNCNNRGTCSNGKCTCNSGFTGTACEFQTCPNNCNNRGTCSNGKCVCNSGFSGTSCESQTCPNNCNGNGACLYGTCKCNTGFSGADCSQTLCPLGCSKRGSCVQQSVNGVTSYVCRCDYIHEGTGCELRKKTTCTNNCSGNGYCYDYVCLCNSGFSGADCSKKEACPNNCSGNGFCEEGSKCYCYKGFGGADCATKQL